MGERERERERERVSPLTKSNAWNLGNYSALYIQSHFYGQKHMNTNYCVLDNNTALLSYAGPGTT